MGEPVCVSVGARVNGGRFVARDRQCQAALAALASGCGLTVVGSAGVGKTALVQAVVRRLPDARYAVTWITATRAARQVLYGPLAALAVAVDIGAAPPHRWVADELLRRAGPRTPVLVVDDAHELDDASAAALLTLASAGDIRLITVVRSGVVLSDALRALSKDGYARRLHLTNFDRDGTAQVLHTMLDGDVARPTVELLYGWTSGNARFLVELVRHGKRDGRLAYQSGLWWWRNETARPPALPELFTEELDELDAADRDVLTAVALGEPLPLTTAEAVAPEAVERLEERRLLRTMNESGHAWRVLVSLRGNAERAGLTPEQAAGIGLNHLLGGNWPGMVGGPVVVPGGGNWPVLPSGPITDYGGPGSGARAPVAYVGAPPARRDKLDTRRPVVAILDTGLGRHPWWDAEPDPGIAVRGAQLDGEHAGHIDPTTDPERNGDLLGPLDGVLDTHSGHGTFIAGLIRQLCPDANLLAIRIMASDGIVDEDELIWALAVLHERLVRTRAGDLDVIVLSLGYYHEALLDPASDAPVLHDLLERLGSLGVIVVAAAGNDGTTRPMYPAAFTPHPGGFVSAPSRDVVPVLTVGSRNPDASVALFSNSGPWVTAWDLGAALISTFPVTFDGGALSSAELKDEYARLPRRTIDPDGYASIDVDAYSGGFGTWSGTSFAAPVLAGRLAQALIDVPAADPSIPKLDDTNQAASVHRGWAAVQALTRLERP